MFKINPLEIAGVVLGGVLLICIGLFIWNDVSIRNTAKTQAASITVLTKANSDQGKVILQLQNDAETNARIVKDLQDKKNDNQSTATKQKQDVTKVATGTAGPGVRCAITGMCNQATGK